MNHSTLILTLLLLSGSWEAPAQTLREQYEAFRKNAHAEYYDFRDKANQEYAEFVKLAWEWYQTLPAITKPKDEEAIPPVVCPENDKEKPIENRELPHDKVIPAISPTPQPAPIAPIQPQRQPIDESFSFTYCSTAMQVRLNGKHKFKMNGCTEKQIAETWTLLSQPIYNNVITDCLDLRKRHRLNDWAYLCMLKEMSEAFLDKGSNEATLLMAYIYCQSGYQMRLAQAKEKLYMLYGSSYVVYGIPYIIIDGLNYYPLDCKEDEVYVCRASYPKEQALSLAFTESPLFAWEETPKRNLKAKGCAMETNVSVNKPLIDFYNSYPVSEINNNFMTRWALYANAPISQKLKDELYPTLRKQLSGLSQKESVERLLNWVQTAFVYEYDDKVWGYDRAFFPDETLYYPYCDCEDRSILFTRIVRDLLGLKCILVYYPGHLAAAVRFSEAVKGDFIMLQGKHYTICDPTYINAPVGMTMPKMNNNKATVILLD